MSVQVLYSLIFTSDTHSVIFNGKVFLVVGGKNQSTRIMKTESCSLHNDQMSCVELQLTVNDYSYYPFLMTVGKNFTDNCA